MTVNLTPAQAKAMGLDVPVKVSKRNRKAAPTRGTYHTRCKTCGEEFRTMASEDRHVHDTHHPRFETVL